MNVRKVLTLYESGNKKELFKLLDWMLIQRDKYDAAMEKEYAEICEKENKTNDKT